MISRHPTIRRPHFLGDRVAVMAAVALDGLILELTSPHLKDDRAIVKAAVENNGMALRYAPDRLRADKDIVHAAVRSNGLALPFASNELRGDKQVVMTAICCRRRKELYCIRQQGLTHLGFVDDAGSQARAFLYATQKLRGDKEVVLAAFSRDSRTLKYAANQHELLSDMSFVARLMDTLSVPSNGSNIKNYEATLQEFPALAFELYQFFRKVIASGAFRWKDSEKWRAAPGLFCYWWLTRLTETHCCLSVAFPGASEHISEFCGIKDEYSLAMLMKHYHPIITVMMNDPNASFVEQAHEYIAWCERI